jgi:hypothetical protein
MVAQRSDTAYDQLHSCVDFLHTALSRLLKKASLRAEGKGLMAKMRQFLTLSPQPLALQDAFFNILLADC